MRALAVIPACNEADRLPGALASLRREGLEALVVANGCSDATANLAKAEGAMVIETPVLQGGVGAARAIGLEAALTKGASVLFTMDADCTLAPGSAAALWRGLERADAVFGRVVPNASEFIALPHAVRRHGSAEDRRNALLALIEAVIADCPWNPFPAHGTSPGALIAWHAAAYLAVGGIEPVACHEDRLMAAALVGGGFRIARPWDAVVIASCRQLGRAPSGMAHTIALRTRAGPQLIAEAFVLERECLALERRLSTLMPCRNWPDLPSLFTKGDDDVPSFEQASV